VASVSQRPSRMRRRKRDATATGRWEGADGGGSGQPGPEGGSHQAHGAINPPGGHMGSPGVRRPMPGEGQKGDTLTVESVTIERYRPEKPTHRAQGREQTTGGSRPWRNVGAAATPTETRGGETGREQREQAAEAQPAARPQEGAGRRRQGERRRRHACPYGTD
jgi:hypothetical protein